ncbi:MAG TPA: glycosyltransferase [Candidatus Binataceae bacterium]|nr:glycosyltransferase [Candidatus Binataceae bacterium]
MFTETAGAPIASSGSVEEVSLSIVIPTRGRPALLQKCLASVFAAELPESSEVLVVCNGSDPATEDYLHALSESEPRLHLMQMAEASPAEARNAAMTRVRGDIVYFLDDDVTIEPDLFARTLDTFAQQPAVDVIGGPNLTPPGSTLFERCAGAVLASRFGSGRVADRYRSRGAIRATDDRSLILCNLAIRRCAIAERRPVFLSEMVCNEENLLLGLLALEDRKMIHDPALVVYHIRRRSLAGFAQQIFKYGRGRWQNTLTLPASLSASYLIPPLFLLYLISLPFLSFPGHTAPLALYLSILGIFSLHETIQIRDLRALPRFLVLFPTCHLAYAVGLFFQCALSMLPASEVKASSEAEPG